MSGWIRSAIVIAVFGLPACSLASRLLAPGDCASQGGTDLTAIATCYADVGKPWTSAGKWSSLSKLTHDQTTEAQWSTRPSTLRNDSVTVLGTEDKQGTTYARVSVAFSSMDGDKVVCTGVTTQTWVQEDSQWRRLQLPATAEVASKKMQDGDYDGAATAADEWLKLDPFSVDAYSTLQAAQGRMQTAHKHRSEDLQRALLSINPADSQVLFRAASEATDIKIAYAFLNKFPRSDCMRKTAVFNVALEVRDPSVRLKLLQEEAPDETSLDHMRLVAMAEMGDFDAVRAFHTPERAAAIRKLLDTEDPAYAATWATMVGGAVLRAADVTGAKGWADYAMTRDPSNPGVSALLDRIERRR